MGNIKVRLEGDINRFVTLPNGSSFSAIEGSFTDDKTDEYVHDTNPALDDALNYLCDLYHTDNLEDFTVDYEVDTEGNVFNIVKTLG